MNIVQSKDDLAWLLVRVTDNEGRTCDRYAFHFNDGSLLCCSEWPDHPQGVSMYGEFDPTVVTNLVEAGEAKDVILDEIPAGIVEHAIERENEGYREWATQQALMGRTRGDILQELQEDRYFLCGPENFGRAAV